MFKFKMFVKRVLTLTLLWKILGVERTLKLSKPTKYRNWYFTNAYKQYAHDSKTKPILRYISTNAGKSKVVRIFIGFVVVNKYI